MQQRIQPLRVWVELSNADDRTKKKRVHAMVDTGCSVATISAELADELCLRPYEPAEPEETFATLANGEKIQCAIVEGLVIDFEGEVVTQSPLVMGKKDDVLLGLPSLHALNTVVYPLKSFVGTFDKFMEKYGVKQ